MKLVILAIVLGLGSTLARPLDAEETVAAGARRMALAGRLTPLGWWHTVKTKDGTFCSLRDFPPIPDGYGSARLYCINKKYDHYFMWRLAKVGTGAISSGDRVQIMVNNPMLKYCQYTNMIICGVKSDVASNFVIEKASGSGTINFATDDVVFKFNNKYCRLDGRRHSQSVKCTQDSKSKATVFQLPYSSFTGVNLVSKRSAGECGGDFYSESERPPIYCSKAQNLGFAYNLTIGLEEPGAAVVPTGKGVNFKVYDDLYSYQVSNFKTDTNGSVFFATNNVRGANSFFHLAVVGGGALQDGAVVTLKAASNGKLCGIKDALRVGLVCDGDSLPSGAAGDNYKFDYNVL